MSRVRNDYDRSFAKRFLEFVKGDKPLPEEDHVEEWKQRVAEAAEEEAVENANFLELPEADPLQDAKKVAEMSGVRVFRVIYYILAVILCVLIIGMLLINVSYMPPFGSSETPMNNEVTEKYLHDGGTDTGVVNMVTGMILQYRAFDTFGETNVLFIAACTVMILLLNKEKETSGAKRTKADAKRMKAEAKRTKAEAKRTKAEAKRRKGAGTNPELQAEEEFTEEEFTEDTELEADVILQKIATVVVPLIFLFGLYILLNGHLSPGGGFSGGAVIGAGLILYNSAFGFRKTERFFDEKIYDFIKVGSLCLYAMIIAYYLFTGANGIPSVVPLGKLGALISSGLILPINILVGLEVACTMYAFYALFRKGSF